MIVIDPIQSHDAYAGTYDSQVKIFNSFAHETLFGMCYEYLAAGETLLDLGIGTGLGSAPFARAGVTVTDLDGSAAMLEPCRAAYFAGDLQQHDHAEGPQFVADHSSDQMINSGDASGSDILQQIYDLKQNRPPQTFTL